MGNVYKSVLAGGTTPTSITPSDSSPASMTAGTAYEPTTNGYAIENQPATLTPSSSAPSISSGTIYKAGGGGYAIDNYTSISQAQLQSGVYFSSGFKKMASSGYAYSSQPTLKETTLWTNSNPTDNFTAQDVTLSQSMANFDYIKVQYAKTKAKTSEVQMSVIISYSDFLHTISSEDSGRLVGVLYYYSTYRGFRYVSDTTIHFGGATSGNTGYNNYCIPTKISGLKI